MSLFDATRARLTLLFARRASEARMDEEIELHVEMETDRLIREERLDSGEARRRALAAFGGVSQHKETLRDGRGLGGRLRSLGYDGRIVARSLRRRPAMVAAIVITLALGIGANTAVFSLIDAVVLRPLAVTNSKRLVAVYVATQQTPYGSTSFDQYRAFADRASTLSGVAAYWTTPVTVGEGDNAQDVSAALVTENYFTVLGTRAALGRTILPSDPASNGANPVAVLSGAAWRRYFAADPAIVGRHILVRGKTFTVIGVMGEDFRGTDLSQVPDLWMPASMIPTLGFDLMSRAGELNRSIPLFTVFGRMATSVDRGRVVAELEQIARQTERAAPAIEPPPAGSVHDGAPRVSVLSLDEAAAAVRDRGSLLHFLRLLVGIAGLTLLLACMNIANLLIVRANEQAKELGVRVALGAGAGRLAQQLLIESLMLAAAGGAAGIGVAFGAARALSAFTLPGGISLGRINVGLNARVLAFTCAMSLLTALVFGLLPARRAARMNVTDVLRDHPAGIAGAGRRTALIAVQVAMSLVLLVGAGLLWRSVRAGLDTGIGFDPRAIAALSMAPKFDGKWIDNEHEVEAVVAGLKKAPGVLAAAAASHVPLAAFGSRPFAAGPLHDPKPVDEHTTLVGVNHVTGDYFNVMGIPIIQGRSFTNQDQPGAPRAIVLNESAARELAPDGRPIGRTVHARWFSVVSYTYVVVGIVHDTKYRSLQDSHVAFAYIPLSQEELAGGAVTFLARSNQPRAVLPVMQRWVSAIAPDRKVARARASSLPARVVSDQIVSLLAPQRFGGALLSGFALLALCVSGVGIYGTVAYTVSRRTPEIGIRMALGARSMDVVSIVLRDTGIAVAIGACAGVVGAILGSRFLEQLLFGVGRFDLFSFAAAAAATIVMAALAALLPSLRSVHIDPVRAIRSSS